MRKMKETGLSWLKEIPEDWQISKIKYVATLSPSCDRSELTAESVITYTPMEYIKNGAFINNTEQYGNVPASLTPYQEGDIAMAKVTPCFENGNIAVMEGLANGFGLGSSELIIFRPENIETRFLFYWLRNTSFVERAISTITGTGGLKRISNEFVRNSEIPLPDDTEQKKIAEYLDKKCSQLDSIIDRQHQVIEKLNAYKLSVITEAVTKGLNSDVPMKDSGIAWIGDIPEYAAVTRVGHLYKSILGKMLSSVPNSDDDTLEDYFCAINVHFDGVDYENIKQMWFSPKEKGIYLVKKGDLLVVEGGAGAGGASVVERDVDNCYVQNSIHIVRPTTEKVNAKFLYYTLYSLVKRNYIDFVCNKATIPHFTKDKLLSVPVVVLENVDAITDYLDKKCAAIDSSIAKRQQLIDKLTEYKKSLIFEVVTGKKEV